MKSYIQGTYIADTPEMFTSNTTNKQIFKKGNRNLFSDTTKVYPAHRYIETGSGPDIGPVAYTTGDTSNFKERSPSKEVVFTKVAHEAGDSSFKNCFTQGFTLTKARNEGFNSLFIKFNKLNKDTMDKLKQACHNTGSYEFFIQFSDTNLFSPFFKCDDMPLADNSTYPRLPMGDILNLGGSGDNISRHVNWEEGYIYLPPGFFKSRGFPIVTGGTSGLCYHTNFILVIRLNRSGDGSVPDIPIGSTFTISNIYAGMAQEVQFEDGIDLLKSNKTVVVENKEGIAFKDIYNTQKRTSFTIPLLTHDQKQLLVSQFFDKHKDLGFMVFPFSWETPFNTAENMAVYENNQFGGYYEFDGEYEVERGQYNTYTITFKVKEVI